MNYTMQVTADLLEQFEAGTINPAQFHHRQHVEVVWLYLQRFPAAEVLTRFSDALRRFARSIGKENLYHATISWAYVLLVNERLERARIAGRTAAAFDEFAAENADLLKWKPSILNRYYREETLWSDTARATFVFPDAMADL